MTVGFTVGLVVVGFVVGLAEGLTVGFAVVGFIVGFDVGFAVEQTAGQTSFCALNGIIASGAVTPSAFKSIGPLVVVLLPSKSVMTTGNKSPLTSIKTYASFVLSSEQPATNKSLPIYSNDTIVAVSGQGGGFVADEVNATVTPVSKFGPA